MTDSKSDVHAGTRTLTYGSSLKDARAAMILLHGRGASPEDILGVGAEIDPGGIAFFAPAAAQSIWYPQTFLSPQSDNQPWLDSALARVGGLVEVVKQAGIPQDKVILLGFSQGACLALEYAARNPSRYGGVAALSGGLIGSESDLTGYAGSLAGTSVFLGCSNTDPYIPAARVYRSGEIMQGLAGEVDLRIYAGIGHMINRDELDAVAAMLKKVVTEAN